MSKIIVLDSLTANMIAAGEVIDRPASVIKELVENSIDAGATSIVVDISDGGITAIRVRDNGSGIPVDDAPSAFLRHATSKITGPKDICAIATLGFRGEALSSIAAVSNVRLYTRSGGDEFGCELFVSGDEIRECKPYSGSQGTSIEVSEIFFNMPARRQFLQKPAIEAGYITDYMQRVIMERPDISFKYIKDGRQLFFSSGDSSLLQSIFCVYGGEVARNLLPVESEEENIKVSGYISTPGEAKSSRTYQSFFINGRYVKSPLLSSAVLQAFGTRLMRGKFPVAVINILIPLQSVDVNIHPSKLDVKFSNEEYVFDRVVHAVSNALGGKQIASYTPAPGPELSEFKIARPVIIQNAPSKTPPEQSITSLDDKHIRLINIPSMAKAEAAVKEEVTYISDAQQELFNQRPVRVIGTLFATYILAELDERVYLIDQHAAHERLRYDELIKLELPLPSQKLIVPLKAQLSGEEFDAYQTKRELLGQLGFEAALCNEGCVAITSIPVVLTGKEPVAVFIDALNTAKEGGSTQSIKEVLMRTACRGAVKANAQLRQPEIDEIIGRMNTMGEYHCPHGRPVVVQMTKKQIEKMFGRIV